MFQRPEGSQTFSTQLTVDADMLKRTGAAPAPALRLRPRAYFLGVVALLLNQFWLVEVELVRWSLFTNVVPFCNALFTLTALLLANGLSARLSPARRPWLHRGELLAVFTMTCIGSALGAQQMGQLLVSFLPYPAYFASAANRWESTFIPYLPKWLTVTDKTSVANFYRGNSSLDRLENLLPWVVPALAWSGFILVLLWTMLCINTLLRRRWMLSERLSFPSVYLPLEMTSGVGFWRNRVFWLGFALAGGITLWNGIAYLEPSLPMVPIKRQDIQHLITTPPWTGIGTVRISFYFFAIGLAFLMPLDLSFSLWFFYLLYKLELVAVAALGLEGRVTPGAGFDNAPPYENGQAFGAYMAVFATTVWGARSYLRDVWRTAFGRGGGPLEDAGEALRYRTALLGSLGGLLLLAGFCALAGMTPWVAVAFFVLYFALSVMITRIRAEFGFPVHDMHYVGPMNPLLASFGTEQLGPRTLAMFGLTFWFNRTYFANPMPHQLEGMRLGDAAGVPQRDLLKAMLLAGAVGAIGLFWAYLHTAYREGAGTARVESWPRLFPGENYNRVNSWFLTPGGPNVPSLQAAAGGFLFALLLQGLRQKVAWFPLHPLAYAVANSWGMIQIGLPIFLGSVLKGITMRYGGLRLYRRVVPFFLGLILGEMLVGCLWTLYGVVLGIRTYDFWP